MPRKEIPDNIKIKIDEFLDSLYMDVQGVPAGGASLTQEYIIKILTRFIMSVCTAYWSLAELSQYIRSRREYREFIKQ